MESFELFKQSHSFYVKEKYLSILKELEHLQSASIYYNTLTDKEYKNFDKLSLNIQKFKEYIKSIYESEHYSLKALEESRYLHNFVILLDIQNKKIEKILKYFSSLHKKLLQLVSETLPHHLPTPSIGKRYSSKVLSDYLQNHANKLYKFLLTDDEQSEIHLYWDHVDHYKLDGYSSDKFLEMNTMRFVSHSFYYHDIVWNIPTLIDREVILHAMKSKKHLENRAYFKNKLNTSLLSLRSEVKAKIDMIPMKKNSDDYIESFIEAFNKETFIVELMSDIIGLEIHGKAYILSFLHETLGRSYGREFYGHHNDGVAFSIPYYCVPERDTQLVRQHVLLKIYLSISGDTSPYLQEAFRLLNFLCHGEGEGVSDPAHQPVKFNKKEHCDTLFAYNIMMGKITPVIINLMSNIKNKVKLFPNFPTKEYADGVFIRKSSDKLRHIPLELWNERFKLLEKGHIPHKSILRQKILEIEFQNTSNMHPYILKFDKNISRDEEDGNNMQIAFGLFDGVKIEPSEIEINMNEEIKKLFSKDMRNLQFVHKHSLIKIKEYGVSFSSVYTIYILITLKNSFDFAAMKSIDEWCKDKDQNIVYYKSLGPQDIVLECFCDNKDDIWDTLGSLRKENNSLIAKTYSIVAADGNNDDHKLDINTLCTLSADRDVNKIKDNIYNSQLFNDMGWEKDAWEQKMSLDNTIGRKSYELNLHSVSLRELEILEKILRTNKDLLSIEYFFIDKV